jgi:hypothetical protein
LKAAKGRVRAGSRGGGVVGYGEGSLGFVVGAGAGVGAGAMAEAMSRPSFRRVPLGSGFPCFFFFFLPFGAVLPVRQWALLWIGGII